jgi:hypothetical protein
MITWINDTFGVGKTTITDAVYFILPLSLGR